MEVVDVTWAPFSAFLLIECQLSGGAQQGAIVRALAQTAGNS
jgi:hypothetical protein